MPPREEATGRRAGWRACGRRGVPVAGWVWPAAPVMESQAGDWHEGGTELTDDTACVLLLTSSLPRGAGLTTLMELHRPRAGQAPACLIWPTSLAFRGQACLRGHVLQRRLLLGLRYLARGWCVETHQNGCWIEVTYCTRGPWGLMWGR